MNSEWEINILIKLLYFTRYSLFLTFCYYWDDRI